MRNLFLLRGAPSSGKSYWIQNNKLEPYTLSADNIRTMYCSPTLDISGKLGISQKNDGEVWELLMYLLECRMKNGEMVIVDATHYKSELLNRYKSLFQKYRYRVFVVDFTNVSLEELLHRNSLRDEYKIVPDEVIHKMYETFRYDTEVSKKFNIITPDEAISMINTCTLFDFNEYDKVVVFGDIHGCYEPVKEYFNSNPMKDNNFYIFTGDYIDRGIQNAEVIEFLLSIYKNKNVLLLEGNHECLEKNTEILTDKGWLKVSDIVETKNKINCRPYTYNIDKKIIELDNILSFHKKYQEKMIHIETNNTRQIVSPNHAVLIGNTKILAKDLLSINDKCIRNLSKLILPTASANYQDYNISDDWLRLLVWVVCDGCLIDAHKNKPQLAPKIRIQFKLSREEKIQQLEELLNRMCIPYTKQKATMSGGNILQPYLIRIYGQYARDIYNEFPNGKIFPHYFKYLSERQLNILLSEIVKTDGSKNSQVTLFYSTQKDNIDILNEICIKNNYSFSLSSINNSGYKNGNKSYSFRITKNWDWVKFNNFIKEIDYNDNSYCLTTKNGTLITRLNGKCAITGNCWLRLYANNEYMEHISNEDIEVLKKYIGTKKVKKMLSQRKISHEFLNHTRVQLEAFDKKHLRQLCDKLGQMAYFNFGNKNYFICHGGIPTLPKITISTKEMIKGVGKYENLDDLYNGWVQNTSDNDVLIHAHRNIFDIPIEYNKKIYNLCDKVEFGKNLRVLEINKDNTVKPIMIKNNIYRPDIIQEEIFNNKTEFNKSILNEDIIKELESSKYVRVKNFDNNIRSYNFTTRAFEKNRWNPTTCTARGLFVDMSTNEVIMRSYNKWFNWGQVQITESANLAKTLVFPVKAYRKENGFLGMVSYNPYTDDLLIGSKSSLTGEFAYMVKEQFYNALDNDEVKINSFKQYLKDNNCTAVFEVIDIVNDPHIIKYDKSKVVLLDIITNQFEFKKLNYDSLCDIANQYNLEVKQLEYTFDCWQDLYDFKHQQDVSYDIKHEGWVFEDSNGFMIKYKTRYYTFWKYMRGVKNSLQARHNITKTFRTKEEVMAYNILKSFDPEKLKTMSIIDIEDIFYESYQPV